MSITTAVILASGFGSRMLPVTATVQKELLPILDRPIVDYVVKDCVTAGITRIIFVIRPDSHGLQDYFFGNAALETHLRNHGKHAQLKLLEEVHKQAKFEFVALDHNDPSYGTAVPVRIVASHLPADEPFVVCNGDDFLWRTDGQSDIAGLIANFQAAKQPIGALMAQQRPVEELHRYGVLDLVKEGGVEYLRSFIEKPAPGQAPTDLINLGKYVLTPELLRYVLEVKANPKSGEFYLTDALEAALKDRRISVYRATGLYLDAGTPQGWLDANLTVSKARSDFHH